jgi:exonuclease SbcC
VRPTKLSIQGLTAYKQPVEIDFTDLDLFAITGPTGAGKSSLVDAITFALYGKAPRVGNNVKELISQGEQRLKVTLEFAANGDRYRIYRSTARKGQAPVQLEHFELERDEWVADEDRAKEATAAIERLLQMDYEAFVRSVLLPQGQFQEFLAGNRDQRRKVLDGLLRLNVYGAMQQRANAIAAEETRRADDIHQRLDTEMADATPDALKAAKTDLKQLKARATELAKLRTAAEDAHRTAEALANARDREREARDRLAAANKSLEAAATLLGEGKLVLAAMDAQIANVASQISAAKYDPDLHLRLVKCLPLLHQVEDGERQETKLVADIGHKTGEAAKLRADVGAAKERCVAAVLATKARQDEYETARHTNATALLRQGIKKGDPCPVCGQPTPDLPKAKVIASDKLKAAWEKAQADERAASEKQAAADRRVAVEENGVASLEKQLAQAKERRAVIVAQLATVIDQAGATAASIERRIDALVEAKSQFERLEETRKALIARRDDDAKAIEGARDDVRRHDLEAKSHKADVTRAAKDAAAAAQALTLAAKQMKWDDVTDALSSGADVVRPLRSRAEDAQAEEREILRETGSTETRIEQIAADIEKAKALRDQEKTCREEATLARDLASLLRTDSFPTFLRQRAMKVLATAGSAQLRIISGGRYDLIADGQDFAVEDIWNASEPRPVRTLSGGETFLASLALALALAEHLPSLAGSGHQAALESLFIDEGFSHLDAETLDTVANALELLGQDRNRLIGVVTHVPALAERMPARITVHKSQVGSTVTVE